MLIISGCEGEMYETIIIKLTQIVIEGRGCCRVFKFRLNYFKHECQS